MIKPHRGGGSVARIVTSIEIARPLEDVFSYVTDPLRLADWQEGVVSSRVEEGAPPAVGSRVIQTRRISGGERTMTSEITELTPPTRWAVDGIDGPVRGTVKGTVQPVDDGARSRGTIELDFEGHGIGKLLVPLVVRRHARREMPINMRKLKERLESGASDGRPQGWDGLALARHGTARPASTP
jgi:uncharacterized protein YndB with AHSA1/START domain